MSNKAIAVIRSFTLFLGLVVASFHYGAAFAQDKPSDIKSLQKERRDLVGEAYFQMNKLFLNQNNISLNDLIQAERDFLKADLDLVEKPLDRIRTITNHKLLAENMLKTVEAKINIGRMSSYAKLQAKAYVLEVQIELLKEQDKQKAKPGK